MKINEGRTKDERKKVRKNLGSLKSLTVLPQTKRRYDEALQRFYAYLKKEKISLPTKRDKMDDLVSDYVEFLWSEGEGRATASNFLAGLQDLDPKLKGSLPSSWRLMKTWTTQEIPNRAPPLTFPIVKAMVGWCIFHESFSLGLSILLAFHGLLRTGELLGLQAHQIHMTSPRQPAVLSLGLTKSGKRTGAAESITITDVDLLRWLWTWKSSAEPHQFLTSKPHIWRQEFSDCLSGLRLKDWDFRPYSLRRGGATALFLKTQSLDTVLLAGRWTAVKTAKIYLNSGLAMLADITIPPRLLTPFHLTFTNFLKSQPKLEHARKSSRAGGRGKTAKKPKKFARGEGFCGFPFSKCLRPRFSRLGGPLGDI